MVKIVFVEYSTSMIYNFCQMLIVLEAIIFFFFFFFFPFENLTDNPLIVKAFWDVCAKKLSLDYYCDVEEYISGKIKKDEMRKELTLINSPFAELYKDDSSYPSLENASDRWNEFEKFFLSELHCDVRRNEECSKVSSNINLRPIEAKAIVNWVYRVYKKKEKRKEVTKQLFEAINKLYSVDNLDFVDGIIYVKTDVDINVVDSFARFAKAVQTGDREGRELFYRGHSNSNYMLLPSIMRNSKWLIHERDMYNEALIECPDEFADCSTHLDYLVHMQHYGIPTRLLDITRNPLVALYFACEQNPQTSGEIIVFDAEKCKVKYPGSDTVSILASLPQFTEEMKTRLSEWATADETTQEEFNKKAIRLLHEIRLEKPAFRDEIRKEDIVDCFFVSSAKKNNRIVKQDGAFVICGLFDEKQNRINNYRYKEESKAQIFIVRPEVKKDILKELNRYSINKAFLFPEISDVADFIKQKYWGSGWVWKKQRNEGCDMN